MLFFALFACFTAEAAAADFEYKSQNGKILGPVIEEGTTVVIHLDLKKTDLDAVVGLAEKGIEKFVPILLPNIKAEDEDNDDEKMKEMAEETLKELSEKTKEMFEKLRKDGDAEHLYIMFNANDMNSIYGPVFLVPVGTKTKAHTDAVRRAAGELDMSITFVRHGFIWAVQSSEWNAEEVWKYVGTRFRELNPTPSPELDEAFIALEAAGDAAQLVVLLPREQTEELFDMTRLTEENIEQTLRYSPAGAKKIYETMAGPQGKIFDALLDSYRWGGIAVQVDKPKATLIVQMKTTEAAATLRSETKEIIPPINDLIMQQMAENSMFVREEFAMPVLLLGLGQDAIDKLLPEPKTSKIVFTLDESNFPQAVELLEARNLKFKEEYAVIEKKARCRANLSKIGRAIYTYYEQNQEFPPAYTIDENEKPLHSWRVLILPALGEDELFEKIKLDEPWDSEHNKQFHSKMPEIYRCPDHYEAELGAGKTPDPGLSDYALVTGKDSMFDGEKVPTFNDNPYQRTVVFERKTPLNWMSPVDIPQEEAEKGVNKSAKGIGSVHEGGANAAQIFNSPQFLEDTISEGDLKKTYNGRRYDDNNEW